MGKSMKEKLVINEKDNIGVCLKRCGDIEAGHKFALKDIKKDDFIITRPYYFRGMLFFHYPIDSVVF